MSESTFSFKETKLAKIPVADIRENAEALRVAVDKEDPDYILNLDSVKKRGIMNPILVREIKDPVSGNTLYGLIDGLHRLNWAMDAGLTEIPAQIGSIEEGDLLEAQIIANVARVETKPVQYTKALLKIMGANPTLTATELATRLSRNVGWLNDRLGLIKLTAPIQQLVDDGTLPLTNAYALSRLPEDKQTELLQQALSQPAQQFCGMAENLRKEIANARREGRKAEGDKFIPVARLQRAALIKDQQGFATQTPHNCEVIQQAKLHGVRTVDEAIAYALSWVLHLDPTSKAKDEADWKAAKDKAAADKQARAAKREEEKKNKAGTVSASVAAAAGSVPVVTTLG